MTFRRTLIKLTLGYLVLIMLITGFLSIILYRVGAQPLERRLDLRQDLLMEEPPPGYTPGPHFLDPNAVSEVKHRMGLALIYFNVAVLVLAGLVSYQLAKRELKPVEAAIDLQGRFTSDAAHELRTPLTAMRAEIEVALRGEKLGEGETRELLESNLEEIGKLEALSSGLLKLAQYGETKGEVGAIELAGLLEESLARIRRTAEAHNIEVSIQVPTATVKGDRAMLAELFVILLDNSVKYSDDGTRIAITGVIDKRFAVVTVKDEGYGIAAADLAHVFDRFYRGKVPAEKQVSGYGLGLSIAKRIAEVNHAGVDIESDPGDGTRVSVRLPLAPAKARRVVASRRPNEKNA